MKQIKKLGIASLVVLTAMAFPGASSVMAESTALCAEDESPCAEGNLITHVHETTLAGSPASLLNSIGDVLCDVLFLGDAAVSLASPLAISGNFTYSNCKMGTVNCTVTELSELGKLKVLKEGPETAKVTYQLE